MRRLNRCKRSLFIPLSKYQLRQQFRTLRDLIPSSYRQEAALLAVKQFVHHPWFIQSEHIACYLPLKSEFDSLPIIEAIWRAKKRCYLPILSQLNEKLLTFVQYVYGDKLRKNCFSILEPSATNRQILPQALDLVILPLIAYDNQGHRLGTGGGYYDKTFAWLKDGPVCKPQLIGLGYQTQQATLLPADPWDVLLEGVITESTIIDFR